MARHDKITATLSVAVRLLTRTRTHNLTSEQTCSSHTQFPLAREKQTWTEHYWKIGRQVFEAVIGIDSDVCVWLSVVLCLYVCIMYIRQGCSLFFHLVLMFGLYIVMVETKLMNKMFHAACTSGGIPYCNVLVQIINVGRTLSLTMAGM